MDDAQVRALLQSPLLTTAAPISQLAIDMIGRTNVLLEFKSTTEMEIVPWLFRDADDPTWLQQKLQTGRELTSRREVADLGNVNSELNRRLLELLQKHRQGQGHTLFERMGLIQPPPEAAEFTTADVQSLAQLLRPWSYKQVERQFVALQKAGLISYERPSANQPWQYHLPEELFQPTTSFSCLPTVESLYGAGEPLENGGGQVT